MADPLAIVKGPVTISVENSDGSALDIVLLFEMLRGNGLSVHGYMIGNALRPAESIRSAILSRALIPREAMVATLRRAVQFGPGGYTDERKCCGAPPGAEHPPDCWVVVTCRESGIDLSEVEGG